MKIEYKKHYKELYVPDSAPSLINVPAMNFLVMSGTGSPESDIYQNAVGVLYSMSYTIKMKVTNVVGYYDYTVFPLEGLWWMDGGFDFTNRDLWNWVAMIRQPQFVDENGVNRALEITKSKKADLDFSKLNFFEFNEGLCVQMMHTGPFSAEQSTVDCMREFIKINGYVDRIYEDAKHHEIYLSDFRKTAPDKLKTVIRHPVRIK